MKEIQPRFAEDAQFIAVDIGDRSDLGELHAFAQKQGYPWAVGRTDRETLKTLGVTVQSTVGNQQKWDTFVKERSRGCGSVAGLPGLPVVAFAPL